MKKVNLISHIAALSLLVLIFILLGGCKNAQLNVSKVPNWWDSKEETTARVVKVIYQPEQIIFYEFTVNNTVYKGGYGEPENNEVIVGMGSRFKVAYNPNNPKENLLLYFKPIFSFNKSDTTLGVLIGIYNSTIFDSDTIKRLVYEYRVGNKIHKCWTYLQSSTLESLKLKSGDIISIKYALHNTRLNTINNQFSKANSILVYLNTNKRTEKNMIKAAERIGFNGNIYWLKHPNLPIHDKRKQLLDFLMKNDTFKTKMQNVTITII